MPMPENQAYVAHELGLMTTDVIGGMGKTSTGSSQQSPLASSTATAGTLASSPALQRADDDVAARASWESYLRVALRKRERDAVR